MEKLFSGCNVALEAHLFQDDRQRTEAGEGGLKQVEANESRKPEPVIAELMCQDKGEKDCKTCKG